jgi:hypothetical protein
MNDCCLDQVRPFEAKITAACRNWNAGVWIARLIWTMEIKLFAAEPICPTSRNGNQLRAQDITIKAIRALPIGNGNDAMVYLRLLHGNFRITSDFVNLYIINLWMFY